MEKKEKKKKKSFDVRVDKTRCKGCGICVALCPKQVLELEYPEVKCRVARLQDCIGCLMCEMHCPDFAIGCNAKEQGTAAGEEDPQSGNAHSVLKVRSD